MTLRFSAIISLIVIIMYAVMAYFLSSILSSETSYVEIIAVLLFVICVIYLVQPFFYSYLAMTILLHSNQSDKVRSSGFFKTAMLGFRRPVKDALMIPSSLIFSILIYILGTIVFGGLIFLILYYTNGDYRNLMDGLASIQQTGSLQAVNNYLEEHASMFASPFVYIQFLASFGAFFFFMHRAGVNSFKYVFIPFSYGIPRNFNNLLFKKLIKDNRKVFYRDYYSVSYIYIIIMVIIYPVAYFSLYFVNMQNSSYFILILTSLLLTILIILPFLPILFTLYETIADHYTGKFVLMINNRFNEEIKVLVENYDKYSPEEQKEIDQVLQHKKEIDQLKKEEGNTEEAETDFLPSTPEELEKFKQDLEDTLAEADGDIEKYMSEKNKKLSEDKKNSKKETKESKEETSEDEKKDDDSKEK